MNKLCKLCNTSNSTGKMFKYDGFTVNIEESVSLYKGIIRLGLFSLQEDNTVLRYVNDSTRRLYAFEMDHNFVNIDTANPQESVSVADDVFTSMETFTAPSTSDPVVPTPSSYNDNRDQFDYVSTSDDLNIIGTGMWEWGQRTWDKNQEGLESEPQENWLAADSTTTDNTGFYIPDNIAKAIAEQTVEVHVDSDKKPTASGVNTVEASSDWKSCAICLEELPEIDLVIHTTCQGTFCSTCLEVNEFAFNLQFKLWPCSVKSKHLLDFDRTLPAHYIEIA